MVLNNNHTFVEIELIETTNLTMVYDFQQPSHINNFDYCLLTNNNFIFTSPKDCYSTWYLIEFIKTRHVQANSTMLI